MKTQFLSVFALLLVGANSFAELNPRTFYGDNAEELYNVLIEAGAKREINEQLYPYHVALNLECSKHNAYQRGDSSMQPELLTWHDCKFSNNGKVIEINENSLARRFYLALGNEKVTAVSANDSRTLVRKAKSLTCKSGTNLADGHPFFYLCSIRK